MLQLQVVERPQHLYHVSLAKIKAGSKGAIIDSNVLKGEMLFLSSHLWVGIKGLRNTLK
jgi:hypothetical protein